MPTAASSGRSGNEQSRIFRMTIFFVLPRFWIFVFLFIGFSNVFRAVLSGPVKRGGDGGVKVWMSPGKFVEHFPHPCGAQRVETAAGGAADTAARLEAKLGP